MKPGDEHRFAKDEDGNLVDATKFDPSERRTRKCYCLSCGEELIFTSHKTAKSYFRHEADKECDEETYLHELGKILLKMRWDKTSSFVIAFPQKITKKCAFNCLLNYNCIDTVSLNLQDLKKFYQTCSVDKEIKNKYGEFKADLLLEDKTGKYDPMMIEVCVTHPCPDEKRYSGNALLEFTVKSEDAALFLYFEDLWRYRESNFYSIPKTPSVISSFDLPPRRVMRAALCRSGKIKWSVVDCKNVDLIAEDEIALAFFAYYDGRMYPTLPASLFFAQKGFNFKGCEICSNMRKDDRGNIYCSSFNKRPYPGHAHFCPRYSPNLMLLEKWNVEYYFENPSLQQNPGLYKSVPPTPSADPGFRHKFV